MSVSVLILLAACSASSSKPSGAAPTAAAPTPAAEAPPPAPPAAPTTAAAAAPARAVIYDNLAIACQVDGRPVEGSQCPEKVTAVSVSPAGEGAISLSTWPSTLSREDADPEFAGPCGDNLHPSEGAPTEHALNRGVTALPTDSAQYRKLIGEAVAVKDVQITDLYKVDLEGDGVDEVVFVADSAPGEFSIEGPGSFYSFVGVRKVSADQKARTILLFEHKGELARDEMNPMAQLHGTLQGFTDLEGDGVLEIVVGDAYYEGSGSTVYSVTSGARVALGGAGCGV